MEHEDEWDEHDADDDTHVVNIGVEYEMIEDEDGEVKAQAAAVRTHIHGVPIEVAAQTLVIIAHKILSDHMAHTTFGFCGNHEIAHGMASAAAGFLLSEAVKNVPASADVISTVIPDDISELLGE